MQRYVAAYISLKCKVGVSYVVTGIAQYHSTAAVTHCTHADKDICVAHFRSMQDAAYVVSMFINYVIICLINMLSYV